MGRLKITKMVGKPSSKQSVNANKSTPISALRVCVHPTHTHATRQTDPKVRVEEQRPPKHQLVLKNSVV